MRLNSVFGLVSSLFLTGVFPLSAEWPSWRGPQGDGTWANAPKIAKDSIVEPVWKTRIGGGYSGVTISEGRVYTMDKEGEGKVVTERVICFSAANGELIWEHRYDAEYGDLPYALGPRASVTLHDGRAFSMGADGTVHCFEATSGKVIWSKERVAMGAVDRPQWGFASSPVIWKDTVIIHWGASGKCYIALDQKTGTELWRGGEDSAGYGTPVLTRHAGNDALIGWTPNFIQALSPDDGKLFWKIPYEVTYGVSIATPIVQDGIVLVSGYWHGSRAIRLGENVTDAELIWSVEKDLNGLMAQPLYQDGLVYLLEKDNGLTCFELKTGETLWKDHQITPSGRNPQATMIRLGDSQEVLVLNSNGELIHGRIDRKGYEEFWREQVLGKTWAHPAYSGRFLFARDERSLICIKLPVE